MAYLNKAVADFQEVCAYWLTSSAGFKAYAHVAASSKQHVALMNPPS
jgi:hypothetical protein